ncbi:hypothetical protein RUM44_004369 [Polyplax serrata]|uniref:Four-jointed box protein 1 n=1 Tax=Polyplax serrata TaxID=468196 RepID=A0ABR1B4G6_POLSC
MSRNTSLLSVTKDSSDRFRRLEAGRWHPNISISASISSDGVQRERLSTESDGRAFKGKRTRTRFRYVCLFTGILAFVLGFMLGTMLPALLVTDSETDSGNVSKPEARIDPNYKSYDSVSFVKESPPVRTKHSRPVAPASPNAARVPMNNGVVNGVYWGDVVEAAMPQGYTEEDVTEWRRFTRNVSVIQIKEGCGRMQNRLLKFSDGTISCCRYRRNTDQIQGELFSYYLGQTLGLRNLVPTTLGLVRMRDLKWSSVRSEMMYAQWVEDKPVVLTKFVPNLITAFIPFNFRHSNRRLHPTDVSYDPSQLTPDVLQNLVELAQWSDMIVFDYLTANLDRVVNNLYNLQWNFAMMDAPTHNLRRTIRDKLLVFLDNESGLLHGYRLLDKYESYHSALLNSLCVFRRSTADVVKRLAKEGNIGEILLNTFNRYEPDFKDYLPSLPEKSIQILNERISRVRGIIEKCESLYSVDE